MVVSSPPHEEPFESALQTVRDVLGQVSQQPTWSVSDDALPRLLRGTRAAIAGLQELDCRLLAEADRRNLAEADGASSTTAWVDRLLGCGRFEASQLTLTARRLTGRYELVRQALAAGEISLSKAQVIRVALDRLPAGLSAETLEQAQTNLLEHAQVLDPQRLARVGMRMWEVIDPDGVDAHEQRLLEREEAKARRSSWLTSRTEDGITRISIRTPALIGETFLSILEGYAAPRRTDEQGPDTRAYPQRLGDAFEEWLSRQQPDLIPDHGGLPATLVITTSADTHRPQIGTTGSGQPIPAWTMSWLACTAGLMLALVDEHGVPLKLGRTKRLFTAAHRLALTIRDKGCIFPGCDRPPSWCEAHHVGAWTGGGPTDLANGCLLCGFHHRLIHTGHWQILMGEDGHPKVIPPDWIDPQRTPIRNDFWHPDWRSKPQP